MAELFTTQQTNRLAGIEVNRRYMHRMLVFFVLARCTSLLDLDFIRRKCCSYRFSQSPVGTTSPSIEHRGAHSFLPSTASRLGLGLTLSRSRQCNKDSGGRQGEREHFGIGYLLRSSNVFFHSPLKQQRCTVQP